MSFPCKLLRNNFLAFELIVDFITFCNKSIVSKYPGEFGGVGRMLNEKKTKYVCSENQTERKVRQFIKTISFCVLSDTNQGLDIKHKLFIIFSQSERYYISIKMVSISKIIINNRQSTIVSR